MMNLSALRIWHRLFLAVVVLLVCQPAWAGRRVALVIGNSAYQNAPPLPNPVNDGAMIATTLRDAGFDVVDSRHDLGAVEMRRALRDFSDLARDADIAVIYYAGHGLEVDGNNYLIPVDAKLERDADVYDEGLSLDRVLVAIDPAKQLRLVILDACRDNPFTKTMKRTMVSRSIERGLAKVEPTSPNTLIAYSAKAGSTALDGNSKDSPFTIALSKHLTTPGLDVRRAFGFVRDDVLKSTGNRQEPFVYGSLGGEDVPLVPAPTKAAPTTAAPSPQSEARSDYELALQIGNKDAFNAFLAQYPEGYYANLARIQLAKVEAEDARIAATEKAQKAEQERARLAADSAPSEQQLKAAEANAKAAEQARIAAEKAKQVALAQAADAEKKRIAAENSASSDIPSGHRTATNNSAPVNGAPVAPKAANPPVPESLKQTEVATLTPGPSPQADISKSVQIELRRVGCLSGPADGEWNNATRRSLTLFNRNAGTKLDVKAASLDTLDTIKGKEGRVCPLVCEHGFKASGGHCSKIVCADGSFLNEDNECEKRRAKGAAARRERDRERRNDSYRDDSYEGSSLDRPTREHPMSERPMPEFRVPRPRAMNRGGSTGQIVCGTHGCQPVQRGCHIEYRTTAQGGPVEGGGGNVQICN
ncbi:MAG: caspase family protein [Bradyrhizobium sp.]|uniref:caspase family protein n=1 Tax=Bradyrhizobium sp. TaxID=376 RepID=UPI0023A0D8C9|nr:caspase family protein [Bradyrhizobium sp.]MDE2065802.1 caspase family protein [Bradyrhizobium sp.]MDE2241360.1 caspase family protein [Bradyrhizobium sp.]